MSAIFVCYIACWCVESLHTHTPSSPHTAGSFGGSASLQAWHAQSRTHCQTRTSSMYSSLRNVNPTVMHLVSPMAPTADCVRSSVDAARNIVQRLCLSTGYPLVSSCIRHPPMPNAIFTLNSANALLWLRKTRTSFNLKLAMFFRKLTNEASEASANHWVSWRLLAVRVAYVSQILFSSH